MTQLNPNEPRSRLVQDDGALRLVDPDRGRAQDGDFLILDVGTPVYVKVRGARLFVELLVKATEFEGPRKVEQPIWSEIEVPDAAHVWCGYPRSLRPPLESVIFIDVIDSLYRRKDGSFCLHNESMQPEQISLQAGDELVVRIRDNDKTPLRGTWQEGDVGDDRPVGRLRVPLGKGHEMTMLLPVTLAEEFDGVSCRALGAGIRRA